MRIIECFVQQEDIVGFEAVDVELPAELLEGVRAKAARHKGADVLGAELHLDRAARVQREGDKTNGAEMMADGTAAAVGPLDQRIPFPLG